MQLQKFYDPTVIVVRQWHHAYLGSRLDSTAMFGNLWLLQHFLGFAVLHNGFSGFRLKIPDFTINHNNSKHTLKTTQKTLQTIQNIQTILELYIPYAKNTYDIQNLLQLLKETATTKNSIVHKQTPLTLYIRFR